MDIPIILTGTLAGSALLLPALDIAIGTKTNRTFSAYFTSFVMAISLALVLLSATSVIPLGESAAPKLLQNDFMGLVFAIIVLSVALMVSLSSIDYMRDEPNTSIYYSLLLFTSLGMILLSFAADLLMVFVAWELMGIPTFILVGYRKKDPNSNEAAVKFFLLGALSTGVLLYGISILFGLTGSTNLAAVAAELSTLDASMMPMLAFGVILAIAGLGLKLSIVPFHMWIPDAYEGAPTTVSTLLSAGTKKAGFVAAIRILAVAFPLLKLDLTMALAVIALATMTLGNLAALTQKSMTRLLAYSSIAQAGYMMIGLAVLPSNLGLTGLLYHSFNHALMQGVAFLAAAMISSRFSKASLEPYEGLSRSMPLTSFSLTIALLGLAGMPPLSGFWSKFILFTAAVDGNLTWLAFAGLLNSALSLGYYGLIVKRMYVDEPSSTQKVHEPVGFALLLLAASMVVIITGIYPAPIYDLTQKAVLAFVP
ncbi:MAG: NADH-quinone oxidoreductase subunit N [Thaumarchaeota archaeon]|nr:NADH-quinone oxidoreductase subunit N [Nitrososphaerota archaeon]